MKHELIYIEWIDIHEKEQTWDSLESVFEWAESTHWVVYQCGFLLKETNDYILITSQISHIEDIEGEKIGNATKIPKGCIIKKVEK